MNPTLALTAATVFVFVLLLLQRKEQESDEDFASEPKGARHSIEAAELAARIFSATDREFVSGIGSGRLQRLYQEERRKVALHWIRQTATEVNGIMRRHRILSRQSPNLDVKAEAKLFCQYLELRLLCTLLFVAVRLVGPHAFSDVAVRAGQLYQRIGSSLPAMDTVSRTAA